ncbi:MAG: hypothetical protein K2Q17_15910 [Nitrospiraceae bacterium]|nr:hypothetical protein [Nitrospiraceae bacterium]
MADKNGAFQPTMWERNALTKKEYWQIFHQLFPNGLQDPSLNLGGWPRLVRLADLSKKLRYSFTL